MARYNVECKEVNKTWIAEGSSKIMALLYLARNNESFGRLYNRNDNSYRNYKLHVTPI